MSDTAAGLNRKINSAGDLQSVVRTMKSLAASSIGQYERAVLALAAYYQSVELGLSACFRQNALLLTPESEGQSDSDPIGAIIFGSDQGLVGQFNEVVADFAIQTLASLSGRHEVWAVGERVRERLADAGEPPMGLFVVPSSVQGITSLVGQIQIETEARQAKGSHGRLYVFYNSYQSGSLYEPTVQRLLPLDAQWQRDLAKEPWPTKVLPEILCGADTLRALIGEHLFISLFRACAESLASENASRLAAMERADQNIDDLLENLNSTFHRLRQSGIDEELFDVISGFEALTGGR